MYLVDIAAHAQWDFTAATASLVSPGFSFMFSLCHILLSTVIDKSFLIDLCVLSLVDVYRGTYRRTGKTGVKVVWHDAASLRTCYLEEG